MIKIAVPNKGSLSEAALEILGEAGYKGRGHSKTLNVVDLDNGVEFFFLRPKDIAIYVARGVLDLGITGRDLALDSNAQFKEVLSLGFGDSTFRYAAPQGEGWDISHLEGKRVATSYPNLVRQDLAEKGISADVIRLDGAVEISIHLGVADVIADVVSTGTTLRQQGLAPFGEPIVTSEAVVIKRHDAEVMPEEQVVLGRIQGILHARTYLMIDYNIAEENLDKAAGVTPGLTGPTVSPLARQDWVAVRAMVPQKEANQIMDRLSQLGAEAILASDLRIARF
ncbi:MULTISPECIES: ATP phosphoribosyltransferase [Corynebacterium]|jgi:ATP phosphoribosyltransferase|uniref:ATP phosphoribosyltransferase n=2 Tax=Corynebacterium TaxID=1716 RepID=A0ABY6TDJ3_9CORY|nr:MULTISPECIES: ATP phosphoribosyltransferase [Corynebacterium]MDK4267013.1 ATP phosphoribosyltransferase [Corynebacterium accolens]MDK4268332.1 ATP phosphoribosyltransferase [Corynebacterium accolens]MDK4334410.1 ATP phosphoribosyltransferase [Corynebacterium accolens]MDK8503946.1 ATP phosphoribosyltransferase [Corynebacterium accolens]MDK8660761.1 ATP phosphoribosyltransferase [Corynebacterium accolens]